MLSHHRAHDDDQPWGSDDLDAVLSSVREAATSGAEIDDWGGDLTEAGAPEALMAAAVQRFGHVDAMVANHARSGQDGALGELTVEMLDSHYATNARSSILLAQAFASQHDGRPGGRIIFFTSGQGLGPMPGEIAYSASKAALAGITLTIADQLAEHGITVNCVNPGPVDTGYADDELKSQVVHMFPMGRWGEPDDPARLVAWLVSEDGRWMTGQVLNTEGGFARWRASRS